MEEDEIKSWVTYRSDRKVWKVVVVARGKQQTKTFGDQEDAERFRVETIARLSGESFTFAGFAEARYWPNHCDRTDKEPRRIYDNFLVAEWGDIDLTSITPPLIYKWIERLKQTPLKKGGTPSLSYCRNIVFGAFAGILNLAYNDGLIPVVPMPKDMKRLLPQGAPKKVQILRRHEIEYLATTVRQMAAENPGRFRRSCVMPDWALMHYTLIWTFALAGPRIGEALALKVKDIDLERRTMWIEQQVDAEGDIVPELKTQSSRRWVPFGNFLADLLKTHITTNIGFDQPNALLFPTKLGGPMLPGNYRQHWFQKAATKCGWYVPKAKDNVTPHTLRHVAATIWHDKGNSDLIVARNLGDSPETVRKTYIDTSIWRVRELANESMDEELLAGLSAGGGL